jgi:DNA-binding response OmpR family regulator
MREEGAELWGRYRGVLGRAAHALVVDDEPAVREVLQAILQESGFEVTEAETANEAYAVALEHPLDLLVVDKNLPERSGVDLLRDLEEAGKVIPSVMITGYPSAPSISAALRAGALDYIAKPFEHIDQIRRRLVSVGAMGIETKMYEAAVRRLKGVLVASRGEASMVERIGRELFAHKEDLRLKTDVLLLHPSQAISETLAGVLALEGISVEERRDVEGALSLVASAGALSAIVSLEAEGALDLIRDLHVNDPLLRILVTLSSPSAQKGIAAVSEGIDDLVLRSEGMEILGVRARRMVRKARQRQLNLFLIGTLVRYARSEAKAQVDDVLALLPATERARVEGLAAPLPVKDEDLPEIEVLAELIETASSPRPQPKLADEGAGGDPSAPEAPPAAAPAAAQGRFEASETAPQGQDRRAHPRHEISLPVKLTRLPDRNQVLHTFTRDISAQGLFAIDANPPPPGTRYEVELRPRPGEAPVSVLGVVVRVDGGRHAGMGLLLEPKEGVPLQPLIEVLLRQ